MNHKKMVAGLTLAILILALLPSVSATAQPAAAPVDPHVWEVLQVKDTTTVLVILKQQANLEAAKLLPTKEEKGAYVYQQLTALAERTQPALRALLSSKGAAFRSFWIQNMFQVEADASLVRLLSRHQDVDHIEFYYPPYPDIVLPAAPAANPNTVAWGVARVNADDAWALGVNGAGAVVGDLDTGVDWDHAALINSYRGNLGGGVYDHNYNWWEGPSGSQEPYDTAEHGTHTMGTIVGDDGGVNQIGMAPGAKWIACPGIGSPLVGPFECFQFFLAPTDLAGNNPRPDLAPHVISNSWSSAGTDYHMAIRVLYLAGIFFSKSGGNTGPLCGTVTNPGQWPEVTAAAAFAQGDTIASFSSRGPVIINREPVIKPDIAAPGVSVYSSLPNNNYGTMSGTSMACPHVTGAVALIISARPELAGQIDTIQQILKATAEPKTDLQCTPNDPSGVPNNVWGYGILDALAAVQMAQTIGLGSVEGTVTDAATTLPLENVRIDMADQSSPQTLIPRYTDASGFYAFGLLPAIPYTMTASLYGYLPYVATVTIPDGVTLTNDIALQTAPNWDISGTVLEQGTGAPLRASLTLEGSPVVAQTDPATGYYSETIAQGSYWAIVRSPGHSSESRQVSVMGDTVENFELPAIDSYYMRVSGADCGPTYQWIDATDGTLVSLSDDAFQLVSLDHDFTFYGNTFSNVYVGSNGLLTFGVGGANKWSGPIPDPATPNDGIYAFSADMNPANGAQGNIYYKWVGNVLVVEYDQVEHYPSGDPETFEMLLDADTGIITIQYETVSNYDPAAVIAGVENGTGTEATPYLDAPTAGTAVAFYPAFGTMPGDQGAGFLSGTVTDAGSGAPIASALVQATGPLGSIVTATTDLTGTYEMPLCANFYSAEASATGYYPSAPVDVIVFAAETTVQDFQLELVPPCDPVAGTTLSWAPLGPLVGENVVFTGEATGTAPITYNWALGDGALATGAVVTHSYAAAGDWIVTLTATNDCSVEVVTATVHVAAPALEPPPPPPPVQTYPNTYIYDSIAITNSGDATLTWALAEVPPVDWLAVSPLGGVLAPGSSAEVLLTYTAPMTPGVYTTNLRIDSNDPVNPSVDIPVEMEVLCDIVSGLQFDWLPASPIVGQPVLFTAWAMGTEPIAFSWNFGDGGAGTGITATHTFTSSATFQVVVSASNWCSTVTMSGDVIVEPASSTYVVYLPVIFKNANP